MQPEIWEIAGVFAGLFVAGWAIIQFFYERRRRRFEILEQSFDVLQRLNEKALETDSNLRAAILSGHPEDQTPIDEARIIYFHYMRINRMFRAYEYLRGGYITRFEADRIMAPHLGTLKPIAQKLPAILARGYPEDFAKYLIKRVEEAKNLPVITGPDSAPSR